eukprot:INCI9963.1.p1 GENE.INCI9963.1~~INCI9963.1.p1  ORF type:complete len:1815 (-),score=332.22 INCI9963.1:221-5665(-)
MSAAAKRTPLLPVKPSQSSSTSRTTRPVSANLSSQSEFAQLGEGKDEGEEGASSDNEPDDLLEVPQADDQEDSMGKEGDEGASQSTEPDREFYFGVDAAARNDAAQDRALRGVQSGGFKHNGIRTARYTWYNFVPRNLLEQFRRIANFYFLIISILMLVGFNTKLYVSSLSGVTTVGTLVLVVLVTMFMTLRDDLKRHDRDKEVNYSAATVLTPENPTGEERHWRDVAVGDLLLVHKNESFPADLLALASSNEDNLCYVETKNIDGESNLKVRNTLSKLQAYLIAEGSTMRSACERAVGIQGTVGYEPPNSSIYTFNGFAELTTPEVSERVSLGGRNLLLRGSTLRNTRWSIGLVLYTGMDTKVVRNSRETPAKMSMIEKVINKTLWIILVIQLLFGIVCDVLYNIFDANGYNSAWYLSGPNATGMELVFPDWLAYLFTFIILFNNLVPISLYVTVEFCNAFQAGLINHDKKMVDPATGTAALCRSTNLCQELGQIEYVFSDKTGTLTQNIMTFKSLSVGGTVYTDEGPGTEESAFECAALSAALHTKGEQQERLRLFFEILAVAHTVVVEQFEDDEEGGEATESASDKPASAGVEAAAPASDGISYQAESPDELAFVESAAAMGFVFTRRLGADLYCMIDGKEKAYTICAVNEFNSSRKRQSCVVRTPEGKTMLFCKGADNVMFERADRNLEGQEEYIARLNKDLYDFACKGLRTLVMGVRELSPEEFKSFMEGYDAANAALVGRSEKLVEMAESVERDLRIVGITAIDDKLQDKVAECIQSLHQAKIKLWVLTGDKLETAINIGFSCKVLLPTMKIVKIRCADDSDTAKARMMARFHDTLKQIDQVLGRREPAKASLVEDFAHERYGEAMKANENDARDDNDDADADAGPSAAAGTITRQDVDDANIALVITGEALHAIMDSEEETRNLLRLTESCSVVIGCRVSPAQKAQMVAMVQDGYKPNPPVTLAIGDGANDVPMIQQAQVGVGVCGREGRQAVNSSDFAISQFKHLERLLMIHGRWNYRRICKVILYSFYKNITLTLVLFYYTFYTGYSGTSLFESTSYMLFNVCFCSLPIIGVGWFDKDMSEETVLAYPEMFISGRLGQDLNVRAVIEVVLYSIIHSLVLFYIPYLAYDGFLNNNIGDQLSYGTVSFTSLVLVMNVRVAFITHTWNWVVHFFLWGSVVFYVLFLVVLSVFYSYSAEYYFVAIKCFGTPLFWVVCLSCMLTVLLIDVIVENIRLQFMPGLIDIGREIDNDVAESRKRKEMKRQSSYLLGSDHIANNHVDVSSVSKDATTANRRDLEQYIDGVLQKKATTVDKREAFYYPTDEDGDVTDIGNDDHLDDAAELKKGRAVSSHGFNFDYAEGGDEHYGTAQRRITSQRGSMMHITRSGGGAPAPAVKKSDSLLDLDAGLIDEARGKAADTEGEQDDEPQGKCHQMGIAIMNQALPAWQPVIVVKWMATCLFVMGLLFFAIGVPTALQCMGGNEHKIWYEGPKFTEQTSGQTLPSGDTVECFGPEAEGGLRGYCTVQITVTKTMPGPVYVMYELDGFYQNYYSYSTSRSYNQTHGNNVSVANLELACGENSWVLAEGPDGEKNLTYAPCGLVAHSFFNDSFELMTPGLEMHESGIAWESDLNFLFRNPGEWNITRHDTDHYEFLYQSFAGSPYQQAFYEENYLNEHFVVWMRAAAFNTFKKPFGIISDGITVDDPTRPVVLAFNVTNEFNVVQFSGSKAINVLSRTSLGGAALQPVFAWLQIALGSIACLAAIGLLMQEASCPRNIKKRALNLSIHYTRDTFLKHGRHHRPVRPVQVRDEL